MTNYYKNACVLSDVIEAISVRRLIWYGPVARRSSADELGRSLRIKVEGRKPT